jgi:hypothetical protein
LSKIQNLSESNRKSIMSRLERDPISSKTSTPRFGVVPIFKLNFS